MGSVAKPAGNRVAPLVVFALAALWRLLHLLSFRELPFYRLPFGDSLTFAQEAARIAADGPFSAGLPYFQGPLYPLVLAALQSLGLPLQAAYWIQCFTGSLTAVLVYFLARQMAGTAAGADKAARAAGGGKAAGAAAGAGKSARAATGTAVGLVAGVLYAFYDAAVFLDVELLAASLATTLAVAGVVLLQRHSTTGAPLALAAAGVLLSLAAWGRPNLAVAVIALVAGSVISDRRQPRRALPFAAAALVTLLLPMARNLWVGGEAVFMATSGGVNFYIGNHRGATGTFRVPPESGLANELDLERISRAVASSEVGRDLSPAEASAYWWRRGLRELTSDGPAALRLYGRKLLLLLSKQEIPNHIDLAFLRGHSPALALAPVRAWLLLGLGLGGIVLIRRSGSATTPLVFAAATAVSILPFFVTDRFRLSLMPILAAFAGVYVVAIARRLRPAFHSSSPARRPAAESGRFWAASATAFAVAIASLLVRPLPTTSFSTSHVNLGALYADLGDLERAEHEFQRALQSNPDDPRASENLGVIAMRRGDPKRAVEWVERSLRSDRRSYPAWNVLGIAKAQLGDFDAAIAALETAIGLFPGSEEARQNLSLVRRQYLDACRALAAGAGFDWPVPADDRDAFATLLTRRGYHRAAEALGGGGSE
jgi:tetratricopeptide (TPR) repeat protein